VIAAQIDSQARSWNDLRQRLALSLCRQSGMFPSDSCPIKSQPQADHWTASFEAGQFREKASEASFYKGAIYIELVELNVTDTERDKAGRETT
jgi:hypothetical protein